jgi:putative Holliday junction resolvase
LQLLVFIEITKIKKGSTNSDLDNATQMGNKKLMRMMGLDIGSHTIGVAISDELEITAQGLKTLRRKSMKEDFEEIATIIRQFEIEKIVVGLPKNMDGTLGKQAEIILKWIQVLMDKILVPVVTWDERLSTVGALKVLLEADLSRRKRKKVIDKLAAVLILQGYLDQNRASNHGTLPQE